MNLVIDLIAIFGGILIAIGVYLQFGLGFSLISLGFFLFLFAIIAAFIQVKNNVFDSE